MKHIAVRQNFPELFSNDNAEPLLVENKEGNHFLILPLQKMDWQQIFFHLYQLPPEIINKNQQKEIDFSLIDELCGSMKGHLSSSEEFAKSKQNEIELEERKWEK
jgi:hypothetical protein